MGRVQYSGMVVHLCVQKLIDWPETVLYSVYVASFKIHL